MDQDLKNDLGAVQEQLQENLLLLRERTSN